MPQVSAADFLPVLPAAALSLGAILLLLSEVFLSGPSRAHQATLALSFTAVNLKTPWR